MGLTILFLYYRTDRCHDVWQFGIVVFVCLTGCLPWQRAAHDDPRYMRSVNLGLKSFSNFNEYILSDIFNGKILQLFHFL